ncbi:MAG: glycosyltransferase [Gemmatimonadota bacterium]|nr:glycosyltransferase [Gemmatimonadota bacterium]
MKRVLIVTYHFPPSNEVGALRPSKFAEYLPEFGWEVQVLRADSQIRAEGGAQFVVDRPLDVESAPQWPGLRECAQRVSGRAAKAADAVGVPQVDSGWAESYQVSASRRPLRDLVYSLMWLPDDKQGWILPAVRQGLRMIRANRPDALLVTSPPHSVQVIGLLLSKIADVPLVADFRDPWVGNPATPDFIRAGPTPRIHGWLEDAVLSRAAAVLTTTGQHAKTLEHRRSAGPRKFHVVPNGFDAAMFDGLRTGGSDRFTITYAGNFYHTRTPEPLFKAIGMLRDHQGVDTSRIVVNLLGDCEFAGGRSVLDMARQAGCESSVVVRGRLPHGDVLGHLVRSDLLLLLATGQPEQVPAKAYEYLAAGPPILALVDRGATAELLSHAAEVDLLFTDEPAEIARSLAARLGAWSPRPDGMWSCPEAAREFDRRETARGLAELLTRAGVN